MEPIISERQFKILKLKAELFDIQNEMAHCRIKMEERMKELNTILKQEKELA